MQITTDDDRLTNDDETSNATTCDQCDSHITRNYYRVFSDNAGEPHGCLTCEGHRVVRGGRQ